MKRYINKELGSPSKTLMVALFGILLLMGNQAADAVTVTILKWNSPNKMHIYLTGMTQCGPNGEIGLHYRVLPSEVYSTVSTDVHNNQDYEVDLSGCVPGSTYTIRFKFHKTGLGCNESYYYNMNYTMPTDFQTVSNIQASDAFYPDKVKITWTLTEYAYTDRSYRVYCNGTPISGDLPAGTTSFIQTGLAPGVSGTYSVRGVVNGYLLNVPAGDPGSTFDIGLKATNNEQNKVILTWKNFSGTFNPGGYLLERSDGNLNELIYDSPYTIYTSYQDLSSVLIPGYRYLYTIRVKIKDTGTFSIIDSACGKVRPNGKISGSVKTPATGSNPAGVGVPGVKIIATLQGPALPTDTTTMYTTFTDANGAFVIPDIYYYKSGTFSVVPILSGRDYHPALTLVTLDSDSHGATVNFTDMSSFTVSGTIMQGSCPMPGVHLLVDGDSSDVVTDKNGQYTLTISTGGTYTIQPVLENHVFDPVDRVITLTENTSWIDFTDTTAYTLEGYFTAGCNSYIGVAKLRFTSADSNACFSDTLTTGSAGYYSIKLPSRNYNVDLLDFTSVDEQILSSASVMAYFSETQNIDLTYYNPLKFRNDTAILNFVYRMPPQLTLSGLDEHVTCSGEAIPLLQQRETYHLGFGVTEFFNGISCPAADGTIIITENISAYGVIPQTDTLFYHQGDVITYPLVPGTPNIVSPYKKFIQAILFIDNRSDTVYSDVIVVGHRPRSQTFTTTTPQIPFHVLHHPPGDASFSYLDKNASISNYFSTSFLEEGSVDTYLRTQLGPELFISTGIGVQVGIGIRTQRDITGTFGTGVSGLTNDATRITSTAKERFQTMGNETISGAAGDVFLGGALNMLYAVSDVLVYNFETCELEQSTTLMMQPDGIATTFIYTENHISNVIIPELESIKSYYISKNQPDSAAFFNNQLSVWQQVIANNRQNISDADFIENKTFSSGVIYENSVQTTRSASHSYSFDFYLDYGVAVEIGASVGGIGLFGGVAVKGKTQWGSVVTNDTQKTTTIGYVLSDDDVGDSYTVDIKEDKVYGVPAFRLIAGRSSCPWEKGTLPREGVQLIAESYSLAVEETRPAVFKLQLANTSQSDETRTYHLVFDHSSNPDGAVLTLGGSPVVGNVPYPYTIPPGQGINATVTVSKGPQTSEYNGLKFTLKSSCDEQIYANVYLDACFYKNFELTIAANGSGTTSIPAGTYSYRDGSEVVLYASPAEGNEFQKWVVGAEEFLTRAIQVTVNGNMTATAYFVPSASQQDKLSIGADAGGTTIPPAGMHYFVHGSTTSITAYPEAGKLLRKWIINGNETTDNPVLVTFTGDVTAYAFFEVDTSFVTTHQITFNQGWNIFSFDIKPVNADMKENFQTLIDNGMLVKIQDGTGNALEDMGVFGGWVNNIGNIAFSEGYKIKVKGDCQLSYPGTPVVLPVKIPLSAGWNIKGYPRNSETDALAVVQQLIDRGKLVKVQDEKGNSLEDYGVFGGWQNNIGNFSPGEGYKIKLNAPDTLTIFESYQKSAAKVPEALESVHFLPVAEGNGVDHMNINLINIPSGLFQPGDEIGIFDGDLCVGLKVIGNQYSVDGRESQITNSQSAIRNLSIPVTATDKMGSAGFTEGNFFTLKLWKAAEDKEYLPEPEIIKGTSTFLKQESTFVSLEKYTTTGAGVKIIPNRMEVKIYPNPTDGMVYFSAGKLSPEGMQVQVFNSTGQMILDRFVNTEPGVIDLSENVNGVYYIRLTAGNGTKTEKVVLR